MNLKLKKVHFQLQKSTLMISTRNKKMGTKFKAIKNLRLMFMA